MDVVGYSKLPMDQQQSVLNVLQEAVRGTAEFARAQAGGELIRLPTGDGMALVFFVDPEAPVRCAMELSRMLREQSRISLRMGIHFGPVYRVADINASRNVAGGGINMAQRVMDCGDAGHILISDEVAKLLGQLTAWSSSLHDLGEVEVKHGVRIHIYNLYTPDAGNPETPHKLSAARAAVASKTRNRRIAAGSIALGLMAALALGTWLYKQHKEHELSATDTILLADFVNKTGDAVFDDTLKEALSASLRQSPFLNLLRDDKIAETLRMMTKEPDTKLTPDVAREVCERAGSKAYINGSISSLGSQYLITLAAVHCVDGDIISQEVAQAAGKEKVIDALGGAATRLREKLGESLSSVESFDVPLSQATTSSFEALKAYSSAEKIAETKGDAAAIPLYKRAIEFDPSFALAYSALGASYVNLSENNLASANFQKAYDLRDRVSEREKYAIVANYFTYVTGELEKANQQYELWAQSYPRDYIPPANLGQNYIFLGQYDKAVTETQRDLELNPSTGVGYGNLMGAYAAVNRLDDAKTTYQQAMAHKVEDPFVHAMMYAVAFLLEDPAEMERQVKWAAGNSDAEAQLLPVMAPTEAFYGRMAKARELSEQVVNTYKQNNQQELAAMQTLYAALWEVEIGNTDKARKQTVNGMALASSQTVDVLAALALARTGDTARAEKMAGELEKRYPLYTLINAYWAPTIRGAIEIGRGNSAKAVDLLQAASPYELGQVPQGAGPLYPVFLRGQAYLQLRKGTEAAVEFQKFLDHRGVMQNSPLGAVARLNLARAHVLQGDIARARATYQSFLTLWKDADADIPILREAKAEFEKLPAK
jgi:eukaryotic-like serine/threonine-protein kinase